MRRNPNFVSIVILISLLSLTLLGFLRGGQLQNKDQRTIKPPLKQVVEKSLEGAQGEYALVIKNLKTGESYSRNADEQFEAGSLYKLWVMGTIFDKINKGELKEDETLSQDVKVLNQEFEIDPDDVELTEGTITLTVDQALNQMITISHNYSALLLTEQVKVSGLKAFLDSNNLKSSVNPPKTTASDIALFFEKLYQGKIVTPEASQKMIELLKNQQLDDGLPKYLPDQSKVAHKTGDIGWFKHDAGIVFSDKGDYLIVILSQSQSPVDAQERIARISKVVYDYFTNPS